MRTDDLLEREHFKILIADDDEPTRMLLNSAVTQWGYQPIEARNGEEAWDILQQPDAPRLLILDWLMPELDGLSLCKRIRQELDHYPYILFLTRVSGTQNIVKGLEAGADEFLLKPFELAELRTRLFAGERIIKHLTTIAKQNNQLKILTSYINTLESMLSIFIKNQPK